MVQFPFGPSHQFAVRYVWRGRTREFVITIVELRPSGLDMQIKAAFPGSDRGPVRLRASGLSGVVDQCTGEVIADPVSWFRLAWLDRMVLDDGSLPLWAAIDALPIERVGPDRSRSLAAGFTGWPDFVGTARRAREEMLAFSARVGRAPAIAHLEFLRSGGGDLMSDGFLGTEWPRPGEVRHLWRLMTIKGVGITTIVGLVDAFHDPDFERAIEDMARYYGPVPQPAAEAPAPAAALASAPRPTARQRPIPPAPPTVRVVITGAPPERRGSRWPVMIAVVAVAAVLLVLSGAF